MVLKQRGSVLLAGVSVLSFFLALSVYYAVDNIARHTGDKEHKTYPTERDEGGSGKIKVMHPLTEILYQQLFQKKPLAACPIYIMNMCKWNTQKDVEINEEKSYNDTKKDKEKQFNGIIRLCQLFGIIKYQDVCFYVGHSLVEVISDRRSSQILQDCAYINNNGYPCVLKSIVNSEYLVPRNVCVSDHETVINVLTRRCRYRAQSYLNNSNFVPFEDLIYEEEYDSLTDGHRRKKEEIPANHASGDNNQQYKSGGDKMKTGTNATTVVCHILLAVLLVVSASVALFEVCRDRLCDKKLGQQSIIGDGRTNATGSSSYSLDNRRCSLVDLTVSRHARRESVLHQQQVILLESSNCSAASSVAPRHQHTKLLGARPPPLLRRSSFPVHIGAAASIIRHSFMSKEHTKTPSGAATPTKATPRRTSMDLSEGDSSPEMAKRRVRFLRRH